MNYHCGSSTNPSLRGVIKLRLPTICLDVGYLQQPPAANSNRHVEKVELSVHANNGSWRTLRDASYQLSKNYSNVGWWKRMGSAPPTCSWRRSLPHTVCVVVCSALLRSPSRAHSKEHCPWFRSTMMCWKPEYVESTTLLCCCHYCCWYNL